jgi:folate-binding protein YgfZ
VSDQYRLLSLQGSGAAECAAACSGLELREAGLFAVADDVFVTRARRSLAGGVDLIAQVDRVSGLRQRLLVAGAREGSAADLDLLRVQAGVATAAGEGGEGVLPQEAGLEGHVSYRKGCYLGQEIMARIEARGNLRRQLTGLNLKGRPAAGERSIVLDGRLVGRLGTVAADGDRVLALAVLRNDLPVDAELEVGGVKARVVALPVPEPLES